MSKKDYQITLDRTADGKAADVLLIPAARSGPVRLQAQPGATYVLTDRGADKAPQQIYARRQGKNLLIQIDERRAGEPDLILESFYEGTAPSLVGLAEDRNTYHFIPNTALETDQLASLIDGGSASQVLGGTTLAPGGASMMVAAAPLTGVAGLGLGTGGMLAAGLLGGAALAGGGGGGGGSGGGNSGGTGSPATSFKVGFQSGEDTGALATDNLTNKPQPKLGGTVPAGNKLLVKLEGLPEQEVTVDALGNWSWAPPTTLADGPHSIIFAAVDASGNRTESVFKLTVDTGPLRAGLTSNFATLNTEPLGAIDNKLNINESENGILVTLTLEETPERDLNRDDFEWAGTSSTPNFNKVPGSNQYQFELTPTAGTTGQLLLRWSDKGKALKDMAGNPLAKLDLQWTQDYDTAEPDVELFGGKTDVEYVSGQNLNILWDLVSGTNDFASISVTLLGQTVQKTSGLDAIALKATELVNQIPRGLSQFKQGYYTLSTSFTDKAGNESSYDNILVIQKATLLPNIWSASTQTPPVGEAKRNDLFINEQGSQTFTGGSTVDEDANDTYVWLAWDAGTPGQPDVDTITDFSLGKDGRSDLIDIKDLLGLGTSALPVNEANLPKFVQVSTFDSDNNQVADATRVSISRAGAFGGSASVASVEDQAIVLQGVVAKTLTDLLPNLDWQATGAVILA